MCILVFKKPTNVKSLNQCKKFFVVSLKSYSLGAS